MFLGLNLLLLAATLMHPHVAQTSVHVVNGVLGKPVNFVTNASLEGKVEAIDWDFRAETGPVLALAELKNGEIKRANPEDRFRQRLEIINKTMLRIKDLEVEDGGEYRFRVKFPLGKLYIQTFHLNIFDPVPQPQIHPEQVSQSLHECNVTLKCLASGKGRFSTSWKTGNPLKGLEESSDWYQLSSNGSELYLFWQPGSLDTNFTCLISNPADQKSISCDIRRICKIESEREVGKEAWWLLFPVLLILIFAILGFGIWKKRRKQSLSTAVPPPLNQKLSEPPDSAMAKRRSPPEGDDEQELDQLSDQSPAAKSATVYAVLKRPTHSFD